MKCEDVVRDLPLLIYGELSFDGEQALEQHLESCTACRAELARTRRLLEEVDRTEAAIPPGLLAQCRRELHAHLDAAVSAPPPRRAWFGGLWSMAAWSKPLAAAALIAIGFFGARFVPDRTPLSPAVQDEPSAARVRFVEPSGDGAVRIIFEESTQRVVTGQASDENIRRLLLAAATQSSDPGLRVHSVDLLSSGPDSTEIRRALLYALQNDPNPGVRLKALDGLRGATYDPETRRTLGRVLLSDDNPGVRTQAIDLLSERKEPEVIGVLQEALRRDENNYVRLKCQRALHEMKASAESF